MLKPPRIVVTRAPHQASGLADALRALGAEPVLLPTIEQAEPSSFAALDAALGELGSYDWLLFTSANGVEAFWRRLVFWGKEGAPLPAAIAAIGPSTARALEKLGMAVTLVPPQAIAESFAEALLPYAKPGVRFLLVRAEVGREHLPDALRAQGAEVTIAPAYRTVIPAASVLDVRALFAEESRCPDAVTFTSSSSVENFFALLHEAGCSLPARVKIASIGPVTSQTLLAHGVAADVEAKEASTKALAEAVMSLTRWKTGSLAH